MKPSNIPRCFGTDGIRGRANTGPLSAENVLTLGRATAALLRRRLRRPGRVGLGWDTRLSSPMLASALQAGLSAGGAVTHVFGVIPTPAVAFLTRHYRLDAGIVISASHNPAQDNGIKYFSATGGKFPEPDERILEAYLAGVRPLPAGDGAWPGAVCPIGAEAVRVYADAWIKHYGARSLRGLRVVADLANGAACRTAPEVLTGLGARVDTLADRPDGTNINQACGSLHPQAVSKAVVDRRAGAGLAFDGDADRVMLVDERGNILNGDRLLGILAVHYARQGRLPGRTVVATIMTNLGLELYLKDRKIRLVRTAVGDRNVADRLREDRLALGGEQSGHILLPRLLPTGDGLLTALEVLSILRLSGKRLSELAGGWQDFPQLLINVPVSSRPELNKLPGVREQVRRAERDLGERGRISLRYSGTEPLARVMVEAQDRTLAGGWAETIADAVETAIGNGQRRIRTWLTCA